MLFLNVLVLIFTCFNLSNALFWDDKCPTVNANTEFKMSEHLGSWYHIETTVQLLNHFFTCQKAQYTASAISGATDFRYSSVLNLGGLTFPISGTTVASASDASAPNILTLTDGVSFLGTQLFAASANYQVVMTDPTSYALVYSCKDTALGKVEEAFILSRSKTLSPATITTLKAELSNLSATLNLRLTPVSQSCNN